MSLIAPVGVPLAIAIRNGLTLWTTLSSIYTLPILLGVWRLALPFLFRYLQHGQS